MSPVMDTVHQRTPFSRSAIVLFIFVIIATVFYALPPREPTWDAAVYWGAGKFIWSAGTAGLWEPLRPPLLPVIFGLLWRAGLPPVPAFVFVGVISSVAAYLLLFLLGRQLGIKRSWLIALATLSPLLVYSAPRGLTEVPAIALALGAILVYAKGRPFLAGVIAAFAFLAKFPMGIVVLALGAAIVLATRQRKMILRGMAREAGLLCAGFAIPILAYLAANMFAYGNPFFPFTEGAMVIAKAGIWLYPGGPLVYVIEALKENLLLVFALPGVIIALRRRSAAGIAIGVAVILLVAYFSLLPHKEVRFLVLVLPLIGLLAALCLDTLASWRWYAVVPAALVLFQLAAGGVYWSHYDAPYDIPLHAADSSLRSVDGTVLVSTPRPALEVDTRLALAYYPVFDAEKAAGIKASLPVYGALLWSDCDIVCAPGDKACEQARGSVTTAIDESAQFATAVLSRRSGDCLVRYVLR